MGQFCRTCSDQHFVYSASCWGGRRSRCFRDLSSQPLDRLETAEQRPYPFRISLDLTLPDHDNLIALSFEIGEAIGISGLNCQILCRPAGLGLVAGVLVPVAALNLH